MLKEVKTSRLVDEKCRWFTDDDFDLFIWYSEIIADEIIGFQICYDKKTRELALTWKETEGFDHSFVNAGQNESTANGSPILIKADKFFDTRIIDRFCENADAVDKSILKFILDKISLISIKV